MKINLLKGLTGIIASSTLSLGLTAHAEEETTPTAEKKETKPTKPLVKKLENGNYRIGKITLNKDTRSITLPARTNIVNQDTVIEYLLVHLNGEKVHEALLITEVDPSNLNIALKLLSYKESRELFRIIDEDGALSDKYEQVPDDIKKAARFGIEVTWKHKGVEKTRPITQWLEHSGNQQAMPATPWVYNGSYVHNNKFKAKLTGSIFTILPDPGAMANYPGENRHDDTLWIPAANLPAEGTTVTVTLKPWKN